jgi:hypothetical protein
VVVDSVEVELDEELVVDCTTEDSVVCPEVGGVESPPGQRYRRTTVMPATSATKQMTISARRQAFARLSPELMYSDRRPWFIDPA